MSTISAAGTLEGKGLVPRRQDPANRRGWLLERSAEGEALAARLESLAAQVIRETTGFDTREIDLLAALLGRFFLPADR